MTRTVLHTMILATDHTHKLQLVCAGNMPCLSAFVAASKVYMSNPGRQPRGDVTHWVLKPEQACNRRLSISMQDQVRGEQGSVTVKTHLETNRRGKVQRIITSGLSNVKPIGRQRSQSTSRCKGRPHTQHQVKRDRGHQGVATPCDPPPRLIRRRSAPCSHPATTTPLLQTALLLQQLLLPPPSSRPGAQQRQGCAGCCRRHGPAIVIMLRLPLLHLAAIPNHAHSGPLVR